jgi:glycosyltransferase involved in cell wall biosynthesis
MMMHTCSIGVMAYNEAVNIKSLLLDLLRQQTHNFLLVEIIVVASGCTDSTQDIITGLQKEDSRIRLIIQEQRQGKAAAINLFLKEAKGEFIVLVGSDLKIVADVLSKVLEPLRQPGLGMTGGRPVPVDSNTSFMGYGVNLLWRLHHQLSLSRPKLGEFVAFKNLVKEIPKETAVDEAYL